MSSQADTARELVHKGCSSANTQRSTLDASVQMATPPFRLAQQLQEQRHAHLARVQQWVGVVAVEVVRLQVLLWRALAGRPVGNSDCHRQAGNHVCLGMTRASYCSCCHTATGDSGTPACCWFLVAVVAAALLHFSRYTVRFLIQAGFEGLSSWWQQGIGSGHSTWGLHSPRGAPHVCTV
jgi:hypothetical protein